MQASGAVAQAERRAFIEHMRIEVTRQEVRVKTLKAKVSELSTEIGNIKSQVKDLKAKKPSDGEQKPCGYCGEIGHYARTCPKKKADEAAKEADKDEE